MTLTEKIDALLTWEQQQDDRILSGPAYVARKELLRVLRPKLRELVHEHGSHPFADHIEDVWHVAHDLIDDNGCCGCLVGVLWALECNECGKKWKLVEYGQATQSVAAGVCDQGQGQDARSPSPLRGDTECGGASEGS